jgi:hypothetical protein
MQHPRGNCFPTTDSSPSTGASQFPEATLSSNGEQTRRWATGRAGVPCVAQEFYTQQFAYRSFVCPRL